MIVVNFKGYKTGKKALDLAKKIKRYLPDAIVAVNFVDIFSISKVNKNVYAQHVNRNKGRGTGFVFPSAVKSAGAKGTLLNHSEHRVSFGEIKERVMECKNAGLKVIVCAGSLKEAERILKFKRKPDAIAYEDPKLIGTGKSITKYNGYEVGKFVKMLKGSKIIPLCGAGIGNLDDVLEAKRLGCRGVLISSAIAKDKKPERFLRELKEIR